MLLYINIDPFPIWMEAYNCLKGRNADWHTLPCYLWPNTNSFKGMVTFIKASKHEIKQESMNLILNVCLSIEENPSIIVTVTLTLNADNPIESQVTIAYKLLINQVSFQWLSEEKLSIFQFCYSNLATANATPRKLPTHDFFLMYSNPFKICKYNRYQLTQHVTLMFMGI